MSKRLTLDFFLEKQKQQHRNICKIEGCKQEGSYPAPKNSQGKREYFWLCLEHVREYNKNWNFFQNMNEQEMQVYLDLTMLGVSDVEYRKFGVNYGQSIIEEIANNPYIDMPSRQSYYEKSLRSSRKIGRSLQKYLTLFDLAHDFSYKDLKRSYKNMAKKLHPDITGEENQDAMKLVNKAYKKLSSYLKESKI